MKCHVVLETSSGLFGQAPRQLPGEVPRRGRVVSRLVVSFLPRENPGKAPVDPRFQELRPGMPGVLQGGFEEAHRIFDPILGHGRFCLQEIGRCRKVW